MATDSTIVAIATPPGEGAIAVTRLSGPDAIAIAARHFRGARSPLTSESHRILFGSFVGGAGGGAGGAPADPGLDTVLLSIFRAPHSYTGEDVVEISSHGGPTVPRAILEALTADGARAARPGEFTERAYRNGKLDLAQAEAVASIVRARSDGALRAAHATLGGDLSRRIAAMDGALVTALAEIESRIDFPGDVRESAETAEVAAHCDALAATVRDWLDRLPSARRRESGVRVAIVGAPNVGKSSILNALLGYDRAIVSDLPGTTRDTIEASLWLDGVELLLTDTAGLREAADEVERLGVERAGRAAAAADLTLVVRDASRPDARDGLEHTAHDGGAAIEVWNKCDLAGGAARGGAARLDGPAPGRSDGGLAVATHARSVATVAIRPGGVDALFAVMREAVRELVGGAELVGIGELPATSLRQESCLRDALAALERAASGLRVATVGYDLVAADLTDARRALGEVVGRGVDDAVVAEIFTRFCIGK